MNMMDALNAYNSRICEINGALPALDDATALTVPALFPVWAVDTAYALGIRVRYEGKLYRCEQTHTSQAGWEPPSTKALWTAVAEPGKIDVWVQPTGAQDSYRIGDKVHYPTKDDPVYVCVSDYNIYAPDVFGWELIV